MQSHFGVEDSKAQEVKSLIRSYPSMRFESNPYSIGGRTYFNISGEVLEFNEFQMKLHESERAFQQSVRPTSGSLRLRKIIVALAFYYAMRLLHARPLAGNTAVGRLSLNEGV